MRRSPDRGVDRDGGFALIEVLVAIGIFATVLVAVLPQLVIGIRSTGASRFVTQAKGVAQGRLARMGNLPYHVAPSAGDYRDVLDYYFRDLHHPSTPVTAASCRSGAGYAAPSAGWIGYVDGTDRCDYEPQAGPLYRYVTPDAGDGFAVVVSTQFLSSATPPVPVIPVAGYDTQSAGHDTPAAAQIGVTVTVLYRERGTLRPVSTFTQIADQPKATTRLNLNARAEAVNLGSAAKTDGALTMGLGLLDLSGAVGFASTTSARLTAATAGLATGAQRSATASLDAPPVVSATTVSGLPTGLNDSCTYACWGTTQLGEGAMTAANALPNAGLPAAPMRAAVAGPENGALSFSTNALADYRTGLGITGPLAATDGTASDSGALTTSCRTAGGSPVYASSAGYLRTFAPTDPSYGVESCAAGTTTKLKLFPTSFAPDGVVQVSLAEASTRCTVTGAAHTAAATFAYSALVRYRQVDAAGTASWGQVQIAPGGPTDPLAAVNLGGIDVGGGHKLGDYIASWSSLVGSSVQKVEAGGTASVSLPGVLNITSMPLRPGTQTLTDATGAVLANNVDLSSALSLTLGVVSCSAQDAR